MILGVGFLQLVSSAGFLWSPPTRCILLERGQPSHPLAPLHRASKHSVIWLGLPYSMAVGLQEGEDKSHQSS